MTRYDYNVEKARALLKEAGWRAGPDGTLVKDGKQLKLRLFYPASFKQFEQVAIIAQQQFGDIGVSIEVIGEELTAFLNRISTTRDYDLYVVSSYGLDPHGMLGLFTTGNRHGYSNPEVDRLRTEAVTVPGCRPQDRQKVYAQVQKIITEDAPVIFLVMPANMWALNTRVEGGVNPKTGTTWPIEKWYMKQP